MATNGSSPNSEATSPAFRGALLVVAGVLVGGLVLANMSGAPGLTLTATTPSTRPQATATTTTTAPATAHTPAEVSVLVLNGVDAKKAIAKPAATTLSGAGYVTVSPRDATQTVTASIVYFLPGYQPDAAKIAAVFSIPPAAVVALPTPAPTEVGDPGAAQVVVVIGPDVPAASG